MTALPPALLFLSEHFSKTEARATQLVDGATADELNRRCDPRSWSILQCIEHLALTNEVLGNSIERSLAVGTPKVGSPAVVEPGWIWRWLLRAVEPPGLKGFAPRRLQPASTLDSFATLQRFLASHASLLATASRSNGIDVNRLRYRHPFVHLKISVGTTFLLIAAHERRHLEQAERTKNLFR